jgi:type II secretion system protein I
MNRASRQPQRTGFSLLEVILALAILGGAVAVLGEIARVGIENAELARDTTHGQLLCQSKLAEIVSGVEPLEAISGVPLGTTSETDITQPDWYYTVDVTPLDDEGLTEVRVTVAKDRPDGKRPVEVTLVRWMIDPAFAVSEGVQ